MTDATTASPASANGGLIANDLQYRVTRTAAREFEEALVRLDQSEAHRSPEMRALMRAGMESQLEDLRHQLAEYEELRAGRIQVLELDSLEQLPDALIRARIAAALTQKELAARLGMREQQVQRYEATRYAAANLSRLQAVADALGVQIHERVVLPTTTAAAVPIMSPRYDSELYRLGATDAWSDLERGTVLNKHFIPISQFGDILDPENWFLCGRRGSGKSAIAVKLEQAPHWRFRESVQGERGQYGEYLHIVAELIELQFTHTEIDIKHAIRRLWEWALPVKAMQTVLSQPDFQAGPDTPDVATIRSYLNCLPPPLGPWSTMGQLLAYTFRDAKNQLSSINLNIQMLNLVASREFISAFAALEQITSNNRLLLVLDTLESYKMFSQSMIVGLQGIIHAISGLITDPRMRHVSIKFFLPAEVYERAFAGLPAKIGSRTVFMRWRTPDLVSFISGRFLDVLEKTQAMPKAQFEHLSDGVAVAYKDHDGRLLRDSFWYGTGFLPRSIRNRMGREEDCLAYIFRHTFRRPRDLIVQMQAIVRLAVEKGEFPRISHSSIIEGVHDTSVLMVVLGDALSPFEGIIPGDVVSNARSMFFERRRIMTGRQLRQFAKDLYILHPFQEFDPTEFATVLLRAGVIGMSVHNGRSATYHKARFEYLMTDNLSLRDDQEYCVHPVLGDLFNMPSTEDALAIYPLPENRDGWLEDVAKI